jgi:glycosyltransferase involved in cell wall biosynthesis
MCMSNNPLISIITPTYNHSKSIETCIDSVLAQDYPNWEQIIIDDGSTDNTADIISEFDDKRIVYIKQHNTGILNLNKTYNKALDLSKGEYIAVLEGDDYWPDHKLGEQIKAFKNPGTVLSWGNAQIVDGEGNPERLFHEPGSYPAISRTTEILDRLLLKNFIPACTVLCRKKSLLEIEGFKQPPKSPYVDYSTWLNLSTLGDFHYTDDVMGYWRHHRGQATLKNAFDMIKSDMDYSIEFFNNLPADRKELLSVNLEQIRKAKNNDLMEVYFKLGRKSLHQKEWAKSREYFKKSLHGSGTIKFYTSICILCSFLRIDFEKLISVFNKTHVDDLISD